MSANWVALIQGPRAHLSPSHHSSRERFAGGFRERRTAQGRYRSEVISPRIDARTAGTRSVGIDAMIEFNSGGFSGSFTISSSTNLSENSTAENQNTKLVVVSR